MIDNKSRIAQIIIDMHVLQKIPIRKKHMIDLIKEVNESDLIGHAVRFIKDKNGEATHISKYRKTNIEKRIDRDKINNLKRGKS
tara:strand:- start:708 stop:959 length:252 start_codon:yes stop_codon:yes gene_type:complete